jgi:hypothetical protein
MHESTKAFSENSVGEAPINVSTVGLIPDPKAKKKHVNANV